jgi:hypothetical protein
MPIRWEFLRNLEEVTSDNGPSPAFGAVIMSGDYAAEQVGMANADSFPKVIEVILYSLENCR